MAQPRVALVTGASRGAGKGIAVALGAHGMTVYVTGRTKAPGAAKGWDGAPLPGTVAETAQAIDAAGGRGVPVICDHADDAQVAALFAQIAAEAGRLDILFNNATFIHSQLIEKKPFWEKELKAAGILNVGLRSAYVASWHAARMMVPQKSGLIAFGSSFGASCYMHGPAYGAQKAGLDKFARDMAHDLDGTGVAAISLWMGPLRTERALTAGTVNPEQYEQFLATAETPGFIGDITWALATSPDLARYSGDVLIAAEIARTLGVRDNGQDRPSYREMLGSPPPRNPAAVY